MRRVLLSAACGGDAAAAIGGAIFLAFLILLAADAFAVIGLAVHVLSSKRSARTRRLLTAIACPLAVVELAIAATLVSGRGRSELTTFAFVFSASALVKVWTCMAAWLKPLSAPLSRRAAAPLLVSFLVVLGLCVAGLELASRGLPVRPQPAGVADDAIRPALEDDLETTFDGGTP